MPPHEPTAGEKKINELNLELIETDDRDVRRRLANALYEAELELDDTTLAGRTAKSPMTLHAVQVHLHPDELAHRICPRGAPLVCIGDHCDSVRKYDLGPGKQIESLASRYRREIHGRAEDPALAQRLFNELLGSIPEYRTRTAIIIVPVGELNLLPFAALVDQGEYALTTHTFSMTPSATVLSLLRERESATLADTRSYVGVAAWTENTTPQSGIMRQISIPRIGQLQPLPLTKREVETIAKNFPCVEHRIAWRGRDGDAVQGNCRWTSTVFCTWRCMATLTLNTLIVRRWYSHRRRKGRTMDCWRYGRFVP